MEKRISLPVCFVLFFFGETLVSLESEKLILLCPDTSNLSLLNYQQVKQNSRLLQQVVI